MRHTPGSCRDGYCGAFDCSRCYGEGASVYFKYCADCDLIYEDCDCEEFNEQKEEY